MRMNTLARPVINSIFGKWNVCDANVSPVVPTPSSLHTPESPPGTQPDNKVSPAGEECDAGVIHHPPGRGCGAGSPYFLSG